MDKLDKKGIRWWSILVVVGFVLFVVGAEVYLVEKEGAFLSPPDNGSWVVYNDDRGFEIEYPIGVLQPGSADCVIPISSTDNVSDNNAVVFKHSFPFEWVDEMGETHDDLTDMSVVLCVVDGNYESLANYYQNVTPTAVANRPAMKIEMGAEGAGADSYYLDFGDGKTLVFSYYYITPFYDSKLETEEAYIPMKEQRAYAARMLETLK